MYNNRRFFEPHTRKKRQQNKYYIETDCIDKSFLFAFLHCSSPTAETKMYRKQKPTKTNKHEGLKIGRKKRAAGEREREGGG